MEGWKEAEEGRKGGSQQKRKDGSRGRKEVRDEKRNKYHHKEGKEE